jgi:hypothetical protein
MKKFEYKEIYCGDRHPFIDSEGRVSQTIDLKTLNLLGLDGWELCQIDLDIIHRRTYIFKREI